MEIKDIQGNILIEVPITESAVKTDELMKQHAITLSWSAVTNNELPLGSFIDYDGVRYRLLAPYKPQQKDEVEYEYKPVFQHPVMRWQYLPFLFYTYNNDEIISKEPDWSLTDNAANFMAAVVDAIKNMTGEDWSYEIADNLPASASLSFSNTDIFSALGSIASKFETEWWFDYNNKVLYLSKASYGEEATLEVGHNVGVPSITQSKDGYYTRFLVFGSTRNIEQSYQGSNTNSIVNKRLTLDPAKYPDGYIDIKEGLTNEEVLSKTLVFDDIYPRSALTISDVKVRLMWTLDDDKQKVQIGTTDKGEPIYDQYAIWYFKIPELAFNEDMVISGKVLSVHFNDGPLQGREFELRYHNEPIEDLETSDGTSIKVDKGDFEIRYIEEGTYIIPSITGLVPVEGNSVTLFNITMPEEYKISAYEELEQAALKEIAKQSEDLSNYSFSSNSVAFQESNPSLTIGRKVLYKNGNYSYSTRVIKLETQLDRPFEQKITIGNEQIKGNTQTLKEEVFSANQNIDLIASINESTQQLVQSYQRTQKALLDSMAKWGDMWQLDKEHNAVRTPYNFVTDGTIAMGSLGEGGDEPEDVGVRSLEDLRDVSIEKPKDGEALVYNEDSQKWENKTIETGLDEEALEQFLGEKKYATQTYVDSKDKQQSDEAKDTFATKQELLNTINELKERLRAVEDWGFQFALTPEGTRTLVTPHNFVSQGSMAFAGQTYDEEFEHRIVECTLKQYNEWEKAGLVDKTKIYFIKEEDPEQQEQTE